MGCSKCSTLDSILKLDSKTRESAGHLVTSHQLQQRRSRPLFLIHFSHSLTFVSFEEHSPTPEAHFDLRSKSEIVNQYLEHRAGH